MGRRYPVLLCLEGRLCVVVGGGAVAERKARGLLECGAAVRLVSPCATPGLERLAAAGALEWLRRPYAEGDLAGAFLAVAATGDPAADARVRDEATARGVLLNAVDDPGRSDFILPAVVRRGHLTVAVSTGGRCPALARRLRERLERELGPEYGTWVEILGRVRAALPARVRERGARERLLYSLVDDPELLGWVREGHWDLVRRRLEERLGWCPPLPGAEAPRRRAFDGGETRHLE